MTTLARDRSQVLAQLDVSRETLSRLDRLASLVGDWQRVINLVGPATLGHLWSRHILDSAQLFDFSPPEAKRWIDLGSGGGFPGLVVAALGADRIGFETILVEADQRKAAFLRAAVREMKLERVTICAQRIDQAIPTLGAADVVSARALAPLADLVKWSTPLLLGGALGVYPKGENLQDELTHWGPPGNFDVSLAPSRTHPSAAIVLIRMRAR